MLHAIDPSRQRPVPPPPDIHPAWCSCGECTGFPQLQRVDLRALGIGGLVGLLIVLVLLMGAR